MGESKYYNYGIKHLLRKDIESINDTDCYNNINLYVY